MSTVHYIEIRQSRSSFVRLQPLTIIGLIIVGQLQGNVAAEQATTPVVTTLLEVVNASGNTPNNLSDLLFEGHTPAHEPVLAPPYNVAPTQRRHLTLADFDNVAGTGHIERVAGGTRLTLDMSGLIPNGVYSVWSDFYKAPGLTPDFANSIAFGAFGATDGSQNTFIASSNGTAHFEGVQPPGPMSLAGNAPLYALDPPVSDYITFLAYHINGQTYGGEPAPAGLEQTFVVHAMADFVRPIPEASTVALALSILATVTIRRVARFRKTNDPTQPACPLNTGALS